MKGGKKFMSKYDPSKLSKRHRDVLMKEFSTILSSLGNSQKIRNFLRDLLTESEEVMLARRLQIAKMLTSNHTYGDIRSKLKVGYENIKSVKHFLDFGWGGYLEAVNKTRKKKGKGK
ncbi:trp operon repressor [Patescibacteria group bacterium]|nr:trp operon repressor [Patescibacteria group bacterium]